MKLGFIGCGVMANAMMGGIIKAGLYKPEDIWGADPFEGSRQKTKEVNGINVTDSNVEVLENCDTVFLTIKPQYYAGVIEGIKDHVTDKHLFISIGAGRTLAYLAEQFGKPVKTVRVMPNTPAQVGEGMSAACPNEYVTEEETQRALKLAGCAELYPRIDVDAAIIICINNGIHKVADIEEFFLKNDITESPFPTPSS